MSRPSPGPGWPRGGELSSDLQPSVWYQRTEMPHWADGGPQPPLGLRAHRGCRGTVSAEHRQVFACPGTSLAPNTLRMQAPKPSVHKSVRRAFSSHSFLSKGSHLSKAVAGASWRISVCGGEVLEQRQSHLEGPSSVGLPLGGRKEALGDVGY